IAPWMLKNWIVLHDPIAPFGGTIFRNPYFHILSMQQYAAYFRRYELPNLWALPLEVTVRGPATNRLIVPLFIAAPLALLALRFRSGRRLLAAGLIVFAPFFANVGTRFLLPALPFFALAVTLSLNLAPVLALLMLFHAVASWPALIPRYADPYSWSLD